MPTAITVVCPHCDNRMRASSEYIGRKGRCPACKSLVEITASLDDQSLATLHPATATGMARGPGARLGSTDVPGWLSGIIGGAVTAAAYLAIFLPLKGTYFAQLFLERGPMTYFIVLITCWGLAMLVMKYFAVKQQMSYAELELELIPLEIGVQITRSNVDQFLGHLAGLSQAQRRSILGRRIQGALEHFKSRNSVPEVQEYLATQAELDASGVDFGYTLLRAFIWTVPILGFIGTVMGIGLAVSGLHTSTGGEAGGAELMAALGTVTSGLAVAFDTTLIALVMAILLLFPTETLRKIEYGMLDRIEAFTNESLLRRMADERGAIDTDEMPEVVRDCLGAAFQEHQRWLAQWQAQVAQLGEHIGADFESAIGRVQQHIAQDETTRGERIEQLSCILEEVFGKVDQATRSWHQSEQHARSQFQEFIEAVAQLQQALTENTKVCGEISQRQSQLWEFFSDGKLVESMRGLAQQVGTLTDQVDRSGSPPADTDTETLPPLEPFAASSDNPPSLSPREQRGGVFGRLWKRRQ